MNGGSREETARVTCHGWWRTDWRYCYVPTELGLSYRTGGAASFILSDGAKIAQSFTATSDMNLSDIGYWSAKLAGLVILA